ncbi:MAG TPA: MFS transporter [Kofleriaceae bacterium]|nr:MFS transporter [Kofleriaceae bacterium]
MTVTADPPAGRAWQRAGLVLFATGWGANHIAPLLLVYRERLALDAAAPALMFGMYALGLVPGLLLAGPLSDRRGRRAVVMPSAAAALGASALLGGLGEHFAALLVGRLLYGLGAGGVMSAGAVWVIELSQGAAAGAGPRRATIALSSGFGFGPLVSGLLTQYAPAPTVLPFAIHVVVLGAMLVIARRVPETCETCEARAPGPGAPDRPLLRIELDRAGWRAFLLGVAPMAPFVFALPVIAFAALPSMLGGALGAAPMAYTGLLCALTLAAGVLVQPVTRRFDPLAAARLGLLIGAAGLALGGFAVASHTPAILLAVAPILGAAYGVCMTAGLHAVQRLAQPEARGGITGLYYVLTYVGFAAPYLLAIATRVTTPVTAIGATTAAAIVVAVTLRRPRA